MTDDATAAAIADDIELLAHVDQTLAGRLDEIAASRVRVCAGTVSRLEAVLETVREAVDLRGRLLRLDSEALRAGGELWLARREALRPERSDRAAH